MIVFPNCKINLGLNVVEKRNDGFHNLETVFLPIKFNDALEIIISNNKNFDIEFSSTGLLIDASSDNNLCVKAYRLIKQYYALPNIKMHLHKNIPMGAGLGGGSADAAYVLKLLNELFKLNISEEKLIEFALQLGSDCPFFIINKPCFATSRGEKLTPIEIDLSHYKLLLINPLIHISTAIAFSNIIPQKPSQSILDIIKTPIENWKENLVNDFEKSVFKQFNNLEKIKNDLYNLGAIYASMTGTGSTFYGIFKKENEVNIDLSKNYPFLKWINF